MCPQLSCHLRKAQIPHWAEQAHPSAPDSAVDFTYTAHCCSHLRQTPDQHQNCFSLNRGIKKKKKRQGPSLSSQKQTPSVPCMLAAGHPGSQQQDRSWGKFGKGLESRPVFLSFSSGTVRSLACREELVHRVGSDAGSRAPPFAHATSYLLGLSAHPVPCSHLRTRRCLRCETAPGSGLLHFSP